METSHRPETTGLSKENAFDLLLSQVGKCVWYMKKKRREMGEVRRLLKGEYVRAR
jgi:hypothetical protein